MFKIWVHHGSLEVFMSNAGLHIPCKTMRRLTKNDAKPYKTLDWVNCTSFAAVICFKLKPDVQRTICPPRCCLLAMMLFIAIPCNSRNAILNYLGDKYGLNGSTEAQKIRTQEPPSLRQSGDRGDMNTDGTKKQSGSECSSLALNTIYI